MSTFRRPIFQFFLGLFTRAETAINHVWGERWNFFYYLGSLPIILLFILLFTGLFMFIYYNMSVSSSYDSVKYMTEHAMFGRFMRNLHRYAADAMMFFVILHLLRVLFEEKFQNHRTLAWITGLVILLMMLVQGVTGYILPLDTTSRFVMEKTSEILAGLKVFGDTLPRSFSSPALLGKWIMWVILIVHLIIPLFFVLLLFIHLLRVSRAKLFPPKHISIAFVAILAIYTLVIPIPMAGKAEAEKLPQLLQPDWFYLFFAPVFENRFGIYIWLAMGATVFGLFALPWLLKRRKIVPAAVTADKCTGCGLCAIDCPYQAMHMVERRAPSDLSVTSPVTGGALAAGVASGEHQHKYLVSIDTDICSGCGVCSGSCAYDAIGFPESPNSSPNPFSWKEKGSSNSPLPVGEGPGVREGAAGGDLNGKWLTLVCQSRAHTLDIAADFESGELSGAVVQVVPCCGKLGVSMAEEIRSAGAKGIIVGACPGGDCWYREGNKWLEDRIAQNRKPRFKSAGMRQVGDGQEALGVADRKVPAEFPILGIRFTGAQKKDFLREVNSIVTQQTYRNKPIPTRLFEFLKPSQWAYSFSMSTLALAALLWVFYMGSSSRFGAVTSDTHAALIRLDFFYQTDKKTCSPDMIPPGAKQAALERMAGLVKLDNLTPEARERMLKQAEDSVASKYCSRARRNLDIQVRVDGNLVAERSYAPAGFQNDGITYVLMKQKTTPGLHTVYIGAHERDTASLGRKLEFTEKMEFIPGEVKLIDFEPNQAKFFLRTVKAVPENATGKE